MTEPGEKEGRVYRALRESLGLDDEKTLFRLLYEEGKEKEKREQEEQRERYKTWMMLGGYRT